MVRAEGYIDREIARLGLDLLEIDPLGLDSLDRRILTAIIRQFNGGPVGRAGYDRGQALTVSAAARRPRAHGPGQNGNAAGI